MMRQTKQLTPEEYEALKQRTMAKNLPCVANCPICGGVGYVQDNVDRFHPDFGKVTMCPNLYALRIRQMSEQYGLNTQEVDLLNWSLLLDLGDALRTSKLIKEVLDRGYGFVYLWGTHGQAKTLMLKIAAAVSLRAHVPAAYCNMVDVLQHLRAAYDTNNASMESERRLNFWRGLKVLCIDEFNRLKESEWTSEKRFQLMDARNVQAVRQETVTLIASNSPPSAQESYLRSRIEDGRFIVIELNAEDARAGMTEDFRY